MPSTFKKTLLAALGIAALAAGTAEAQRRMERLDRGAVAVRSGEGHFLSWRLLGTDPADIAFNVYKGGAKLNSTPIANSTNYVDNSGGVGAYQIKAVVGGTERTMGEAARVLASNFISIPLKTLPGNTPNDVSPGDLDGDGVLDLVVKQEMIPRDNSIDGNTGETKLEAYKMDGTFMWRINLGKNIREGAHYTQFMVHDFDGDGKAEVICKTADGTIDGAGKVIGNAAADHRNSRGYIMTGPEFLTVFEGSTGKAMQTVDYNPPRGNPCDWGDPDCATYANRVDRFLAAVAYLDGVLPSAVMCRGYYTRTVLAAWDWRGGKLTQRWVFDSKIEGKEWEGQGNHGISVADVDADGKDEIIYGAMAVSSEGKGLWNTRLGHGDAMHVSDMDPARPGLEIWDIHEGGNRPGADFRNARTGQVYWQLPNLDTGRGMAADITAASPGFEMWTNAVGPRSPANTPVSISTESTNFAAWWDGDLLRELLNGNSITKPGGGTLFTAAGCSSNNGTKSTPALSGDLFGDWREEVVFKCGNGELRIFTTTTPTEHRLYTLLHDPQYRLALAWQNVAYNQPPHVGFFLGAGMAPAPRPNITTDPVVVGVHRNRIASPGRRVPVLRTRLRGHGFTGLSGADAALPVYMISGRSLRPAARNAGQAGGAGTASGVYLLDGGHRK